MIILKHLTVERFRLLREINLHFPQRGSILIQGPNEAGKSALLESIYFALYGEPIASDRSRRTLDDLVLYGASQATVTLTASIGATEMIITRTIERGKGQQAAVRVRRLGMPEEEIITRIATANERIIAELGRMDGETLRNSCFIEQKGLSRLEDLEGREREATIRKLLGLEKLLRLTEQFKLTPNDERMLLESTERLKLAEIQARIPELSQQLSQIEAALDAVTVCEDLAEIRQQEEDITEQQLSLQQLRAKRAELKGRLNRIQQLLKADSTLHEIIEAYDAIAEARRELPELDRQIVELDRREREELPALEKRVYELGDLIRSFGTLERMSNDLLTTIGTIKQLEQELQQYQERERSSNELDELIIVTRLQLDEARQSLQELEERGRADREQLEARLQRLRELRERVTALREAEEEYNRLREGENNTANSQAASPLERNVQEAEQELFRVEAKAKQAEQQADALEKRWRQPSIGRQLEEWQRVKGVSQNLANAEQHVMVAYQNQERLTLAAVETRQAANRWLMISIGSGVIGVILAIGAFFAAPLLGIVFAGILGLLAVLSLAGAGWSWFQYIKVRKDARIANQQMQEAINQVGRMVAAREMAMRTEGNRGALAQVEQEIRSLGGTVPRTREEAQYLLSQLREEGAPTVQDGGENLVDIASVQRLLTEKRNAAAEARDAVNEKMEILSARRKRLDHFEQQRERDDRKDIEAALQMARVIIQDRQQEIVLRASQEGLPIPAFETETPSGAHESTSSSVQTHSLEELEIALEDMLSGGQAPHKAFEQEEEGAPLDAGSVSAAEWAAKFKTYDETLDILLARKSEIVEQMEHFQAQNPTRQIERAREQQVSLRTALQGLQDSLRERVKPMGVAFGQAAVSNAEGVARKQLESLHILLGNRIELQSRRTNFATILKDRQDSLSEHYHQLAKFSGSLGSWIVPPNPFAETLTALRNRCQQEILGADESSILQELENLQLQERASLAKVDLCRQEIEVAQERIAGMLIQRSRPAARGYSAVDVIAVWPLVGEYGSTASERGSGLTEEHALLEHELQQLEQQELELSTQLHTGGSKLDLEQARLRKEQQERSYQTRKRGSLLVNATSERLLRKMLPRTEYYMQQILPLLTSGRYHDVRLKTEEEEGSVSGGPLQLHVWDTGASEYLPKSLLSGGAADQLSLALRLAFAIAVLPHELTAAPGFVFLDEPLSSFDSGRTQALVDVVTGEILGQHFEQILLVSHSSAFDPAMFPYHVYLEGGVIVESNLPVVPSFAVIGSNGHSKDNDEGAGLSSMPAASIAMEA